MEESWENPSIVSSPRFGRRIVRPGRRCAGGRAAGADAVVAALGAAAAEPGHGVEVKHPGDRQLMAAAGDVFFSICFMFSCYVAYFLSMVSCHFLGETFRCLSLRRFFSRILGVLFMVFHD